jgi:hypothetical protein
MTATSNRPTPAARSAARNRSRAFTTLAALRLPALNASARIVAKNVVKIAVTVIANSLLVKAATVTVIARSGMTAARVRIARIGMIGRSATSMIVRSVGRSIPASRGAHRNAPDVTATPSRIADTTIRIAGLTVGQIAQQTAIRIEGKIIGGRIAATVRNALIATARSVATGQSALIAATGSSVPNVRNAQSVTTVTRRLAQLQPKSRRCLPRKVRRAWIRLVIVPSNPSLRSLNQEPSRESKLYASLMLSRLWSCSRQQMLRQHRVRLRAVVLLRQLPARPGSPKPPVVKRRNS